MITSCFNKFRLSYDDCLQEKEYCDIKNPLNMSFSKYLFIGLTILSIPLTFRFYFMDRLSETYIGIGFIALSILIFLFKRRLRKCFHLISLIYISALVGVCIYNVNDFLVTLNPQEAFYVGYGLVLLTKMIDFRMNKFYIALGLNITFMIGIFLIIHPDNVEQIVFIICLQILPIALSFKAEKADRFLFDSLYRSKNLLLKFKHLLTEYLPNPIAVFAFDYSQAFFMNDAFTKLFASQENGDVKGIVDNLMFDSQNSEENRTLLQKLAEKDAIIQTNRQIKLSSLIKLLGDHKEIFTTSPVISFQLKEPGFKAEDPPCKEFEKPKVKKIVVASPDNSTSSYNFLQVPGLDFSKNLKCEESWMMERSQFELSRRDFDIPTTPFITPKNNMVESICEREPVKEKLQTQNSQDFKNRIFKVKMFPLTWDNRDAIALVLDDVTYEKTIMELKIADKNKDLVIAMVSHELRTPINGMLGLLEMMKKDIVKPEVLSYLNACKTNSRLLLNLVNSILDFSQIKNKKLRLIYSRVVLSDLLAEVKTLFDHFCQMKNLFLDIEIDQAVPKMIITDQTRLSQIVINLLGNAFKFTFKGGVTLKIGLMDNDSTRLKFSVIDTGIGIKKEDQEKLFKLFGRLEQQDKKINTQGVGLGLTISNDLAILLDSYEKKGIQVESETGKGTIFSFCIQLETKEKLDEKAMEKTDDEEDEGSYFGNVEENMATLTVLERVATHNEVTNRQAMFTSQQCNSRNVIMQFDSRFSSRNEIKYPQSQFATPKNSDGSESKRFVEYITNKKTEREVPWCLIVDDNPFNLMVAINIMKERGFQVKTALNGQDAINTVKEHNNNNIGGMKVILMDCQMPVMDGYEASRILTEMMRLGDIEECPIVALSANNQDDEHEKMCNDAGMSGWVQKPLNKKDLEDLLKRLRKFKSRCI